MGQGPELTTRCREPLEHVMCLLCFPTHIPSPEPLGYWLWVITNLN